RTRGMDARQELDQRGLARAVLAAERVDLPGPQVEGDALERGHAAETLDDAPRLEDRPRGALAHRRTSSSRRWKPSATTVDIMLSFVTTTVSSRIEGTFILPLSSSSFATTGRRRATRTAASAASSARALRGL